MHSIEGEEENLMLNKT